MVLSLPRLKRPRRKADHSPPSSVEVENEWSYTSISLHAFMARTVKTSPAPLVRVGRPATSDVHVCQSVQTYSEGGGRDSSVGIATRYRLDGPGIESRWEAKFSAHVQTGTGAHPASYTMGTGSFQGVKRPERGVDHPPTFKAEVEERVELYICSPSGPSWPVLGTTFPNLEHNQPCIQLVLEFLPRY